MKGMGRPLPLQRAKEKPAWKPASGENNQETEWQNVAGTADFPNLTGALLGICILACRPLIVNRPAATRAGVA
jgi:hypothetical protein